MPIFQELVIENTPGVCTTTGTSGGPLSQLPGEAGSGNAGSGLGAGDTITFNSLPGALMTVNDPNTSFTETDTATLTTSLFGQPAGTQVNGAYELLLTDPNTTLTYTMVVASFGANNDDGGGVDFADFFFFTGPNGHPPTGVALDVTSQTGFVNEAWDNSICFCRDTLILTEKGQVPVQDLRAGDAVLTLGQGNEVGPWVSPLSADAAPLVPRKLRWIGCQDITLRALEKSANLYPVRITAGALGDGLPSRDLLVSRQHRLLIRSRSLQKMLGLSQALIPANKLLKIPGIYVDKSVASVTYYHLLFDNHEVLFAEGAPSESLLPGSEALKAVSPEARLEICSLFPDILQTGAPVAAASILDHKPAKSLVEKHVVQGTPVIDTGSLVLSEAG